MSRVGQCPSCHVNYELADDAIGHAFQCDCGSALFACDISGFGEIPVVCSQCQGEYVVDRDGAGEIVECECGAQLTVPTVVLRLPVVSADAAPEELLRQIPKQTPAEADQEPCVECPGCGQPYAVTDRDQGDQAACKCGAAFMIGVAADGRLIATKVDRNRAAVAGDDEPSNEKPARRKQPVSLISIIGLAAVALLLLVSIVMFVTRNRGKVASADKNSSTASSKSKRSANVLKGIGSAPLTGMQPTLDIPTTRVRPIPAPGQADTPPDTAIRKGELNSLLAAPPPRTLPQPKPARPVIPVIPASYRGLTLERAYAEAFEAYSETNRLKAEADKSGDQSSYHRQLGETLGLLQQTLAMATREHSNDKIHELRYLLTYLYFTGGHLAEASVLGEAVARWGDAKAAATKEAAMIALAAAQEANETGWGSAKEVGELDQMRTIAEVIAKRWPDHPQLDLIWMSLAQRYDSFNKPLQAADAFDRIKESSQHYGAAQLAAGGALWALYRTEIASGTVSGPQQHVELRNRAKLYFQRGVAKLSTDGVKPTLPIVAAKVSLAKIAILSGDLVKAEAWLVDSPVPVIESVSLSKSTATTVRVTEPFLRMVYETLFAIRTQRRDPAGAKTALELMATKLGPGKQSNVGKMFLGVATDYIDQLLSSAVVTREQFSTLSELIEPLKEHDTTLTVANVLWLGESWSRLAPQASTPQLSKQCYAKAAAAYELAMSRADFPPSSRQSATIRRAQLLRSAGNVTAAIPLFESILKDNANAFDLQIEAAEALEQAAFDAEQPVLLASAIHGPIDSQGQSTGSPIWGWAKLVTTLYAAGSSDAPDASKLDRLLKCQYHLANCQFLIAKATTDETRQAELMANLRRSLQRLVATTSPDREPWYGQLKKLEMQVVESE